MTVKQTAGRDSMADFAPAFARYNDDVLFGEVWSDGTLSLKSRSMVTVTSLVSQGVVDSSLTFHLQTAKTNGVSRSEIAALLTQVAFYAGWPKAWAALKLAKAVYEDEAGAAGPLPGMAAHAQAMPFEIGEPNDAYARYFDGPTFLSCVLKGEVPVYCVTFSPGVLNVEHIHTAATGGGQLLVGVAGEGRYALEDGVFKPLKAGESVFIPAGVKHRHGAAPGRWFSHLSIEIPGTDTGVIWLGGEA